MWACSSGEVRASSWSGPPPPLRAGALYSSFAHTRTAGAKGPENLVRGEAEMEGFVHTQTGFAGGSLREAPGSRRLTAQRDA